MTEERPFPLDGIVAAGECETLGWPEPREFDQITALRNRPAVRRCFLDPRPLDPAANREWLARGMKRPIEGLLAIRLGDAAGPLCGTIGWSGYDAARRTFEIGRLIVDARMIAVNRNHLPHGYCGIAVDASNALLRFVFEALRFDHVTSRFLSDLALPRRVNLLAGGVPDGETEQLRADGSPVRVTRMLLTRQRWRALERAGARITADAI
jgi:RimJ/RimL family protein N-acetyltransferase